MSGWLARLTPAALMAWSAVFTPVWAEDSPPRGDEPKMARLEALLDAQQKKIDALEQQVAAQGQADMNGARIEEMRKQIREVLSEREFRESLMPSTVQAGYDKGFFIRSTTTAMEMRAITGADSEAPRSALPPTRTSVRAPQSA